MGDTMFFPETWKEFLKDYEFKDSKEIYTNGSMLIPSFRVEQMMEHYTRPRRGRWECVYIETTGETDVTCSCCKDTRTINGCFVTVDGESCYSGDNYCPNCGAKMDI